GGGGADGLRVVAASLPGYGLSFRPGQRRFGIEEIADCFADLMTGTLGYSRFAAQGGDWGGITASRMGYAHAGKLIGIHVNLLAVRRDTNMLTDPVEPSFAHSRAAAWAATLASPAPCLFCCCGCNWRAIGRISPRRKLAERSEVAALRHEAAADAGAPAQRTN